jgi:hypothetical protein
MFRYIVLLALVLCVWAVLPPTSWRTAPFSVIPILNNAYGSVGCDEGGHMIYYSSVCAVAGLSCTLYRWNTTGSATLLASQAHTFALAILNPTLSTLANTIVFSYDVLLPPASYLLTLHKSNLTQKSLVTVAKKRMGVYLSNHDIFLYH